MSKKQAIAFFEEISKNQQLAKEVEKVVGGKNSDKEKAKELISLAKKYNFNFSVEEAASAQEALKKPLSHEEMLEVSGGKLNLKSSIMAMTLLAGLGVGGVTMSGIEASAMKRSAPSGFNSSSDSGKRGKDENGRPRKNGNRSQTQPATTGTANSRQNETPPSNDQEAAQSNSGQTMMRIPSLIPSNTSNKAPRAPGLRGGDKERVRASAEHDKEDAKRFKEVKHCGPNHVNWSRRVSSSGALPAADWPAAPPADLEAENGVCRFCGGTLSTRGKNALDVKCANAGCIYNWVFPPTGDWHLEGNQRGQRDRGHYARWALLPALILDSRHTHIHYADAQGMGRARTFPIETPAEAWAVWQLIVGHHDGWVDVRTMMAAHNVDPTIQNKVVRLLEESYNNLVLGNESFIDLGSEVQQLVARDRENLMAIMGNRFLKGKTGEALAKAKKSIDIAVELMEHAYNMLTDEQLQQADYDPTQIPRNPEDALAEIKAAHQRFEIAMQQEKARRQKEKLSVEQAKKIAPMLKCGNCGNTGAKVQNSNGRIYFYCKSCNARISKKHADLLAMLEEAAPGNVSMEMAPVEPNEPQMITPQDMSAMEMDDDGAFDMYDYYFDDDDNPSLTREEKERREDYENMQMMEEDSPVENQTRHNVVPSAFRPSTEDFQIIEGTEFNQELQGSSQRHLQLMIPLQAERRFEMQHKDYENQETNPNIPQLPHLQPHRSMILENTNETITPLTTENLDDIGDALINEISNEAPDFARIQSMLQSAKEARANILQLRSFDDVLIMVKDAANYHRRDDIIKLIDSWFF